MGHIRRQDDGNIRANHRLLEWKENVRYGIQVTARPAPNVRDIQVSEMNRLNMQRGLEFMVIRLACRKEAHQSSISEHARNGIHDEEGPRLSVNIATPAYRGPPQFPSNFPLPHEPHRTLFTFRP